MIGWRAFLICLTRSLFPRPGDPVRRTPFRLFATFVLLPLCLVLWLLHHLGFLLDDIFFRAYRRTKIRHPLFVIGPPRSGTTFLHRALALDQATFTSFTLGEMVFAPSITEKKLLGVLALFDRALGSPVARRIKKAEARGLQELNDMHWVSFFEPEEDYVLLAYRFANPLLIAMFPFPDVLGHLWRFDQDTPPAARARVLHFYKRCVQRHLYHHGPHKIFLSKNPYFTQMVDSLADTFPDARFVCNVRDPHESLPSMLGLWRVFYGTFGSDPRHYLARDFVVDYMLDLYQRVADHRDTLPAGSMQIVDYPNLIADPRATVQTLYQQLRYDYPPEYDERLTRESRRTGKHKSKRQFRLTDFGLDETTIAAQFAPVATRLELLDSETKMQ